MRSPIHQLVLDDLRAAISAGTARVDQLTAALVATAGQGPFAPVVQALQALHGIGSLTAVGLVAEIGDLTRFDRPAQLMAFAGLVPSEHSRGGGIHRGHITKTGNAHVRRLLVEAAWHYARPATTTPSAPATEADRIAALARTRLARRYGRLVSRGKPKGVAIVAVSRELLGVCWAMAMEVAHPRAATPVLAA